MIVHVRMWALGTGIASVTEEGEEHVLEKPGVPTGVTWRVTWKMGWKGYTWDS